MAKATKHGIMHAHTAHKHMKHHGATMPHHKMHEIKHFVGHEKVAPSKVMHKHHKMKSME
ncbi:MAG: hypothetical protein ACREGC_00295 [Minisyncoccia bacterium]